MSIEQLMCNNCMKENASFYKIIKTTLPECRCACVLNPKLGRKTNRTKHPKQLSMIEYLPENCKCVHREEYTNFITRTLRINIPILEFKGIIPDIPVDNNIVWYFLACDSCVKDRQWVKNYMTNLSEYNVSNGPDTYLDD